MLSEVKSNYELKRDLIDKGKEAIKDVLVSERMKHNGERFTLNVEVFKKPLSKVDKDITEDMMYGMLKELMNEDKIDYIYPSTDLSID